MAILSLRSRTLTPVLLAAVLLAAICGGCGGAPAPAQTESPDGATPAPAPGYGMAGPQDETKLGATKGTTRGVRVTSKPKDQDVPGGGSSAPPTGEAETDEGEEVVLGSLPTFRSQDGTALSSLQDGEGQGLGQAIHEAARAHRPQLKQCKNARLAANPKLHGVVTVAFVIGTDGRISNAKISHSDTEDSEFDRCVLQDVEQWEIAPPPKQAILVALPLVIASPDD
ncbi:MAG: TonB family protein [Deltaproteobacteria bacterium]|nr:TonB family protein [Deltaproteobacteria bacterium]